jgi:exonuclease III
VESPSHACEAPLGVEDLVGNRGIEEPLEAEVENQEAGWNPARKRYESHGMKDTRSIVIWGVSPDTSILELYRILKPSGLYKNVGSFVPDMVWREAGEERLIYMVYKNMVARDANFAAIVATCTPLGWKALKSRHYARRQQHRSRATGLQMGEVLPIVSHARYPEPEREGEGPEDAPEADASEDEEAAPAPRLAPEAARPRKRAHLKLGSLNVRGGIADKIGELEDHFLKEHYDIIALQEVRASKLKSVNGYKYFSAPVPSQNGGAGFLVAFHLAALVHQLPSESPHQLWLKLSGTAGTEDLYICSAYMPQESASKLERETDWEMLVAEVVEHKQQGEVVVVGDMNARLGKPQDAAEARASGKHLQGRTSRNGKLLHDLLREADMVSLGGCKRPPQGQPCWHTRTDPSTGLQTMIDHFIVPEAHHRRSLTDFAVDYTDLDSDHHLLSATVYCPRRIQAHRRDRKFERFCIEKLRKIPKIRKTGIHQLEEDPEVIVDPASPPGLYQSALETVFREYSPALVAQEKGEEEVVHDFIHRMEEALRQSVGTKVVSKRYSRAWFTEEVKAAILERRRLHKIYKADPRKTTWATYQKCRRDTRKTIRLKKRELWDQMLEKMADDKKENPKRMWKSIKAVAGCSRPREEGGVFYADGRLAVTEEERREAWGEYQSKLGEPTEDPVFDAEFLRTTQERVRQYAEDSPGTPADPVMDAPFSAEDVICGLEKLQLYKAGSFDQVRNEMLKAGGEPMVDALLLLFNWINSNEQVPGDWAKSLVVFLHKDGDRRDPGNFRGISLISCLGKLYLTLWNARITVHLESNNHLAEEQGGFRTLRSTLDQVYTLFETLLRRRRQGKKTYVFFIDFRKAFDSVWHDGLWLKLFDLGIKGKAWRILRSLYANLGASVLVGGKPGTESPLLQGVRQGDPLSPILFNIFINELVEILRGMGGNVMVGNRNVFSLLYADDIALTCDTPEELQRMIVAVDTYCKKWRLSLNAKKSEILIVSPPARCVHSGNTDDEVSSAEDLEEVVPTWFFRGRALRVVPQYKYLGVWFTENLSWERHVQHVTKKGKSELIRLRGFFAQKLIPIVIKRLVYTSLIRSRLEYASPIWRCNSVQEGKLESIQQSAAVWMLRTNKKASNAGLRMILGLPQLKFRRDMLRLFYLAKLHSMSEDRLATACLNTSTDYPSRLVGRSQSHWIATISKLIHGSNILEPAYAALLAGSVASLPAEIAGESQEDWTDPVVAAWRLLVRHFTKLREIASLKDAFVTHPTLELLSTVHESTIGRVQRIVKNTASHSNWIRIRMLCGTSALNVSRERITRSTSQLVATCPICELAEETSAHFLRECTAPPMVEARRLYELSLTRKVQFTSLSLKAQCAFMLGCTVPCIVDGVLSTFKSSASEDAASESYVARCYTHRSETLTEQNEEQEVIDLSDLGHGNNANAARDSEPEEPDWEGEGGVQEDDASMSEASEESDPFHPGVGGASQEDGASMSEASEEPDPFYPGVGGASQEDGAPVSEASEELVPFHPGVEGAAQLEVSEPIEDANDDVSSSPNSESPHHNSDAEDDGLVLISSVKSSKPKSLSSSEGSQRFISDYFKRQLGVSAPFEGAVNINSSSHLTPPNSDSDDDGAESMLPSRLIRATAPPLPTTHPARLERGAEAHGSNATPSF